MRRLLSLLLLIPFASTSQTTLEASSKLVVDDGYDYTELSVNPWGASHGIFFGSKVNYTGADNLWGAGNVVYARDAGQYSYGAFSMGYIANGGQFSFYDGGVSTGVGNQIAWNPVMSMVRGGRVGIGTINPSYKFVVNGGISHLKASSIGIPTKGSIGDGASMFITNYDELYGILGGVLGNGDGWMQVQRVDGNATVYNLNLQPNGGTVGVGCTNPTSTLTVNGDIGIQESGVKKYHLDYYNGGLNIAETNAADYRFFIKDGGNIGIGTANPAARFHVVDGQIIETSGVSANARTLTLMNTGTSQVNFGAYHGPWRSAIQIQNNDASKALFFAPPDQDYNYGILRSVSGGIKLDVGGTYSDFGTNALTIETNGNIGINTEPYSQYKLAVNGDAIFTKVKVKTYSTWPDYVFHPTYKLLPLKDLENYIKQNNHLPDVPSASEVESNGLDLGENQAILLKKIEELTLYIIEQDKKITAQDKKIQSQQDQIKQLLDIKKEIETIKAKLQNIN